MRKGALDKLICAGCANIQDCIAPCNPMVWIDGDKPRKEMLLKEDLGEYDYADYNAVLAERIEHEQEHFQRLVDKLDDERTQAIVVLLDNNFKIPAVARILKVSIRTIYRNKRQ